MSIFNYLENHPWPMLMITFHCKDDSIFKELDAYHHYVDEEAVGHHDDALRYLEVWMCSDEVGSHCK